MADKTPDKRRQRQVAVINKMIRDPNSSASYDDKGNRKTTQVPTNMVSSISNNTAQILDDVESQRQLLPDIELIDQILISSILSPKDLSLPHVTYTSNHVFESTELAGHLLEYYQNEYDVEFEIKRKLPIWLRNMLFKQGASIDIFIPESTLDDLIHEDGVSLESADGKRAIANIFDASNLRVKNLGILNGAIKEEKARSAAPLSLQGISTSHQAGEIKILDNLWLVDNPDALKMPLLIDRMTQRRSEIALQSYYSVFDNKKVTLQAAKNKASRAKEDFARSELNKLEMSGSHREIEQKLDSNRVFKPEQMLELEVGDVRKSRGHPLALDVGPEALIPIIGSGPDNHMGYVGILDQQGRFVNTRMAVDHYRDLQQSYKSRGASGGNQVVSSILSELRGSSSDAAGTGVDSFEEAQRLVGEFLDKKILRAASAALGTEDISIGDANLFNMVCFSRLARRKGTQLLFIPKQMVSYKAFFYNNHGVGKSLLENSRVLASMRILLMTANLMTAIRNSTPDTELDIQFDPTDSDPEGSMALVVNNALRMRADNIPLGQGNISSMVDFLNRAGITVVTSGHPDMPEMKVTKNERSRQMVRPDTDLMEELRKMHLQNFGLTPEVVDASKDINLATSVIQSSLMLAKRTLILQTEFEPQVDDLLRKRSRSSEIIVSDLMELIETHGSAKDKKDSYETALAFIDSVKVSLPKPEMVTLKAQMEAFQERVAAWDAGIEFYFGDDTISAMAIPGMGDKTETFKNAVLNYLKRDWLRRNNIFPELDSILSNGTELEAAFKLGRVHGDHVSSVERVAKDFLKYLSKQETKLAKAEEAAGGEPEEGGLGTDPEPSTDESTTDETADSTTDTDDQEPAEEPIEGQEDTDPDADAGTKDEDNPNPNATDNPDDTGEFKDPEQEEQE